MKAIKKDKKKPTTTDRSCLPARRKGPVPASVGRMLEELGDVLADPNHPSYQRSLENLKETV